MMKIPRIENTYLRMKAIKHFVTVVFSLFMFQGIATIALTSWLVSQQISPCNFIGKYFAGTYILLTAAIITTCISIVGLYRTLTKGNSQFLRIFFSALMLVIFLECISAIVSHVQHTSIASTLPKDMTVIFTKYYSSRRARNCVSKIQTVYKCCGDSNYTDWTLLNNNSTFPESCLCQDSTQCTDSKGTNKSVFEKPCSEVLTSRITSMLMVLRVTGPVIAAIQTVLLIMGMYIISRLQNIGIISAYAVQYDRGLNRSNHRPSITESETTERNTNLDLANGHM